ncbi:MAG: 16S rRNA (uracil(1498)-N(3))-methyltransferase [Pseudomonadales bacterium]
MNLILLEPGDYIDSQHVRLHDTRFKQILQVHGSQIGDQVRVGELNGLMGSACITELNDQAVTLAIELDQPPPAKLPLTVVLALPRPKMIRRIFRSLAELGVDQLIVINSYKVEKSFWQSPALHPDNIRQYLVEGLQQAKDTILPQVHFHKRFKPFVEDQLPSIIEDSRALIAHPGLGERCPHQLNERITLAVGPEGGFIPYEVEKLQAIGFEGVDLGERILKVENALTTLIAKLYD